jgi:(E)-2-((N-methylformamido)methylene)succinate hydrolase
MINKKVMTDRVSNYASDGTYYELEGEGARVLVLGHGVGLDLTIWDRLVHLLRDDFRVLRYDMLCHGRSSKPFEALSLEALVKQLDDLVKELTLEDITFAGFSMGGLLAMAYAIEHPDELSNLVIMNATYKRPEATQTAINDRLQRARAEGPQSIIDAALERWFTEPFQIKEPEVIDATRRRLKENEPEAFLAAYDLFVNQGYKVNDKLDEIEIPTLAITSEFDQNSTPAMAEMIAAEVRDGRAITIPGLKHMAPVEGADIYAQHIRDFLL